MARWIAAANCFAQIVQVVSILFLLLLLFDAPAVVMMLLASAWVLLLLMMMIFCWCFFLSVPLALVRLLCQALPCHLSESLFIQEKQNKRERKSFSFEKSIIHNISRQHTTNKNKEMRHKQHKQYHGGTCSTIKQFQGPRSGRQVR